MNLKLMNRYKYHLDKSSKKYICPNCGKKRFVKYIETETGFYVDSHYGRCDRESSCGYSLYPNNNTITNYEYTTPISFKTSYIDNSILYQSLKKYEINPLVNYLYSRYDKEDVDNVIKKYNIGTSSQYNGSTVCWQVDNIGKIRAGKIMGFNASTGKRTKANDGKPDITWVHSVMKIPEFCINQCLFGLHLLKEDKKQIAVVEGEKTAIVMSLELPKIIWMATGSLSGFKTDFLKPLKEYSIIAFPDKGGYDKWQETAIKLNNIGFNIMVSKEMEKPKYEDGWDLVDVIEYEEDISA